MNHVGFKAALQCRFAAQVQMYRSLCTEACALGDEEVTLLAAVQLWGPAGALEQLWLPQQARQRRWRGPGARARGGLPAIREPYLFVNNIGWQCLVGIQAAAAVIVPSCLPVPTRAPACCRAKTIVTRRMAR